jgi:hypothetical protein
MVSFDVHGTGQFLHDLAAGFSLPRFPLDLIAFLEVCHR